VVRPFSGRRTRLLPAQDNVRMRLLRLAVLLLMPGLFLAGLVTWRSYRADRAEAEADLSNSAATLGKIVDAEIGSREVRLRLLAATDQLADNDIPAFANLARVTARFGARIVLRNAANQWLVDTGAAAGVAPGAGTASIPWELPPGGKPLLQWAHDEAGLPQLLMTVAVETAGQHRYNLTAFVPETALQATLPQLRLNEGWIATLYDSNLRIVARSAQLDRFREAEAGGDLRSVLSSGATEVDEGKSPQSGLVMFAATRSPVYGVALTVEAPADKISEPSLLSLVFLLGEGSALVALGLLGALGVARSISSPIEALAKAAHLLGEQPALPSIPGGLVEADEVARAMNTANAALIERRAALSDLNANLAARVAARTGELAQANRALEQERTRLGLILDHMPIGVLVSRPDGVVLYTNAEVRRLLNIGTKTLDVTSMPVLRRAGAPVALEDTPGARARRGQTTQRELMSMELSDGHVMEVEVSAGPVFDADGMVALSVTTMQDVSDRVAADEARRRSQRLEAVGQLTGGVAHEFNNLLMAISGCLDLLAPHVRGERARTLLESASHAGERGARLTRQLLAFARRQHLQPEPVDLNALIASLTDLLASTLGRSIAVVTRPDANAWPAMADATQLELVLLNLAINARDAMPGGGQLTIGTGNATLGAPKRAEMPPPGEYAVLLVADTGTGMSPEILARIFEPFFTTKEVGRGSGLGLPQVLGVAQELGGGVGVDSAMGEGTTISVFLPRAKTAPVAVRPTALAPPQPRALQGTRVMLVDDDAAVREVARSMLEDLGAVVIEAEGGPNALLLLRTGVDVDLVLADFTMPHMTGVELATHVAGLLQGVPVVLMTGYSASSVIDASPHISAVLQKPFRAKAMADVLVVAIGNRPAATMGGL
jgi:PAS domain S-box-containing protein